MNGHRDEHNIFQEPLYVDFRDTDRDQHVKLSVWIAWMAGLAGDDYEERGLGRDQLISEGQVFLVNRFVLKVTEPPKCYQTLKAMTWEHSLETVFFNRNHRFETPEGETIAEGRSAWLLCDPQNHRILRPRALKHEPKWVDREVDCPPLNQIPVPEQLETLGQRKIVYTDLDANRHVYCANYGNIIDDFLPDELVSRPFKTFEITYAKEALLGETLDILGADTPDGYVLIGRHPDGGNSFISRISF